MAGITVLMVVRTITIGLGMRSAGSRAQKVTWGPNGLGRTCWSLVLVLVLRGEQSWAGGSNMQKLLHQQYAKFVPGSNSCGGNSCGSSKLWSVVVVSSSSSNSLGLLGFFLLGRHVEASSVALAAEAVVAVKFFSTSYGPLQATLYYDSKIAF